MEKKKRKKKKPERKTESVKKKKTEQPTQEKKSQSGQKLQLVLFAGPSCVFNYKNAIELWVMETKNNQKLFSVSITHNLKIRELSDETELWKQSYHLPNNLFDIGPTIFELWVMETENWVIKKGNLIKSLFG